MPYVGGYFRRSPGGRSGPPSPPRRLDVAIYGEDGALLRDRSGARYALDGLRFDSGLPGGFLSASFALKGRASNLWPGRAGLKVIIRRGARVLWWGWIEDVQRSVRGRIEEIGVTCLGPWQQAQQRLCSVDYSSTIMGDAAVLDALRAYCTELSTDGTQIQATGVDIAPLSWTNRPVADLVKLVSDAGNSSAQPMLFAIWEPSYRTGYGYPTPLNDNPHLETPAPSGTVPASWNWYSIGGYAIGSPVWQTAIANSPAHGYRLNRGGSSGTVSQRLSTDPWVTGITPGTTYIVDFWCYFGAVASISVYARCNWYTAADGLISQVAGTTRNSTGSAFSSRYLENFTAPANAAKLRLDILVTLPDSGANAFVVLDDIYVYQPGTPVARDEKPRAHLWPRDLSSYDYLYFTALGDGLPVNVTTRELANAVIASYGTGPNYTTWADDAESQGLYRRRDALVAAGNVSATVANATRDAHLARHSEPSVEPGAIRIERPGALRLPHGGRVWPEDLRAGDRVRIADGPDAGRVALLTRVEYADGVVTATPERPDDAQMLLAKSK